MGILKSISKIAKVALPVVGGLVGGPVGSAIGKVGAGLLGSSGSKDAAGAMVAGNQGGIDALTQMYGQARQDLQPYQQAGTDALGKLGALYNGDYSGFNASPDYKYALEQGEQAINRAASATGGRVSGNSLLALNRNAQGLATQNLGNYSSRLMQLAGMGQGAVGTLTGAGLGTAGGIGSLMAGQGEARASGIISSTASINKTIDSLLNGGSGLAGIVNKKPGETGGNIATAAALDKASAGSPLGRMNLSLPTLHSIYTGQG